MAKIFVDASHSPITGKAGIGIPCHGISKRIKAKGSLSAELIAVIIGLTLATGNDIIYTDCLVIVKAIGNKTKIVRHEKLCANLYKLLNIKKGVRVKWTKRDTPLIRRADSLARAAANS